MIVLGISAPPLPDATGLLPVTVLVDSTQPGICSIAEVPDLVRCWLDVSRASTRGAVQRMSVLLRETAVPLRKRAGYLTVEV